MSEPDLKKLAKKFPEQDIEWRVQQCGLGGKGPWALIIPYITNRAIMARLDAAAGPANWKNEFKSSPCGKGYLCGISIKLDSEWVTRWDGAEISSSGNIDDVKSTLSSSMKRTGVQWGIGRYLYQFDAMFADSKPCDNRYDVLPGYSYQTGTDKKTNAKFGFQWKPKPLETWALPVTEENIHSYINSMIIAQSNEELKKAFGNAYKLAISEDDDGMLKRFTDAKDKAKMILSERAGTVESEKQESIDKIVAAQIEIINSAVNESAVNGLRELSVKELNKVARGRQLKDAIGKVNQAAREKLNQIKGGSNG